MKSFNFMAKPPGLGKLSLIAVLIVALCSSTLPALSDCPGCGCGQSQDCLVEVNYDDCSIMSIDTATLQPISYMKLDSNPVSFAVCPSTMCVAVLIHDDLQKIVIVNIASKEVISTIPLISYEMGGMGTVSEEGIVDQMFWSKDGSYLYVCTDQFFVVIDKGSSGGYEASKCIDMKGEGSAMDMSPDGSAILLFHKIDDDMYILDRLNTSSNEIEISRTLNETTIGSGYIGPIKYSVDGKKAYTIRDDRLYTIDNSTLGVLAARDLPAGFSILSSPANRMDMETSPDGGRLYILYASCKRPYIFGHISGDEILAYDLNNSSMSRFRPEGCGIGNIALSTNGSLIYATNYCSAWELGNTISILKASTGENVGNISVGSGPYDVKVFSRQTTHTGEGILPAISRYLGADPAGPRGYVREPGISF